LSPIAAPGILGFYSFAVPAVILGVRWAQWYGTSFTAVYIWPMLLVFGLLQILCALFNYHARDNLGTAFHGIWGALWSALGIYYIYVAYGVLPVLVDGHAYTEVAIWFAVLAALTATMFLSSFAQSLGTVITTAFTCAASILAAIAYFHGAYHVLKGAGWIFFFAGIFAFITASAWLLEYQFMRPIIPFSNYNIYNNFRFLNRGLLFDPVVVNRGLGESGVIKGQ
jgi:succinate-acetate transporter protein